MKERKKVIQAFIKDHIRVTLFYWCAFICIIIFYQISVGDKIEVRYPFELSLFFYGVYMGLEFVTYARRIKGLRELEVNPDYEWNSSLELDQMLQQTIKKVHKSYHEQRAEREELEKKDQRFLSMWLHNMKTPITVNDLLWQKYKADEVDSAEAMEGMKTQNDQLLKQLNLILEMSRLKEFSKDYVPEALDMVGQVKEVINQNKKLFIYHKVYPKLETDMESACVLSDARWNQQILNQLISNAVKYSYAYTQKSESDEKQEEQIQSYKNVFFYIQKENNRVKLMIRDQGIGIPEHDLCRVCEPFFTGENGRKGYSSSGIGLYVCDQVAKQLGHELSIESKVGEGTKVTLTYLAKL